MSRKKMGLRIAWMIPNVILYVLFVVLGFFVITNAAELREINRLGIWVIALVLLLLVALFGSYRIRSWIKQGKI